LPTLPLIPNTVCIIFYFNFKEIKLNDATKVGVLTGSKR
jgi:hypothetical protein